MRKPTSARPRGRPFTANDPRANRKGRPRKADRDVFDEIGKAASRGDVAEIGKLLSRLKAQKERPHLDPDATEADAETSARNLRRLMPELFAPSELDLVRFFEHDHAAALAVLPVWIARVKLGLFEADEARGWPELSP